MLVIKDFLIAKSIKYNFTIDFFYVATLIIAEMKTQLRSDMSIPLCKKRIYQKHIINFGIADLKAYNSKIYDFILYCFGCTLIRSAFRNAVQEGERIDKPLYSTGILADRRYYNLLNRLLNDWDIPFCSRNIVYRDKRIKHEFHRSVIAYRQRKRDLNYLVEKGAELSIIFRLIRTKFWLETFDYDIVIDCENKYTVVKGKDVFK